MKAFLIQRRIAFLGLNVVKNAKITKSSVYVSSTYFCTLTLIVHKLCVIVCIPTCVILCLYRVLQQKPFFHCHAVDPPHIYTRTRDFSFFSSDEWKSFQMNNMKRHFLNFFVKYKKPRWI